MWWRLKLAPPHPLFDWYDSRFQWCLSRKWQATYVRLLLIWKQCLCNCSCRLCCNSLCSHFGINVIKYTFLSPACHFFSNNNFINKWRKKYIDCIAFQLSIKNVRSVATKPKETVTGKLLPFHKHCYCESLRRNIIVKVQIQGHASYINTYHCCAAVCAMCAFVLSRWSRPQRHVMGRTSRVVVAGARQSGKTSILEKAIYANSTTDKVRPCSSTTRHGLALRMLARYGEVTKWVRASSLVAVGLRWGSLNYIHYGCVTSGHPVHTPSS